VPVWILLIFCNNTALLYMVLHVSHCSVAAVQSKSILPGAILRFPRTAVQRGRPKVSGKKTAMGMVKNRQKGCLPYPRKDASERHLTLLRSMVVGISPQDFTPDMPAGATQLKLFGTWCVWRRAQRQFTYMPVLTCQKLR